MTERLREIEQRCEKADEVVGGSSAGWGAYLQDIPYLLGVIKEQAEEIEGIMHNADAIDVIKLMGAWIKSFDQRQGDTIDIRMKRIADSQAALEWAIRVKVASNVPKKLMESNGEHSEDAKPLDG